MKVTKKLAAIGVAMIMAISTVSFTASANNDTAGIEPIIANNKNYEDDNIKIRGVTTHSTDASGNIFGLASSFVTNKTSMKRHTIAQANIYDSHDQIKDQSYRSGDLIKGEELDSREAETTEANSDYAIASGTLYNNSGTSNGGIYTSNKVYINFIK